MVTDSERILVLTETGDNGRLLVLTDRREDLSYSWYRLYVPRFVEVNVF